MIMYMTFIYGQHNMRINRCSNSDSYLGGRGLGGGGGVRAQA